MPATAVTTSSSASNGADSAAKAAEVLLRWPREVPLAALVSGGGERAQNSWSVFAAPRETVVIDGSLSAEDAIAALDKALARTPRGGAAVAATNSSARTPPFDGGWVVALGYGLGACFEPHVGAPRRHDDEGHGGVTAPHAVLHWCEDAWCLDHATGELHAVGRPPALAAVSAAETHASRAWSLSPLVPDAPDAAYAANVARVVEYIRAGDAFQANVARRFSADFAGDLRSFAHAAISRNGAWFGAAIDLPGGGCLVSMSPELFLRVRPDGSVVTRPIKGTRPSDVDARELVDSGKDAAELAMIVDLMRNDLGRVAEIGSVRVAQARVLETHSTVHHGVAEVSARLREDLSWRELLAATFPPGSVTGAPKVRAMQIIDELEPCARGFYCGAIGFIARSGHAALSVAIRTAQVDGANADAGTGAGALRKVAYHAGCGIVVESVPAAEVAETHAKARAIARLSRG